MKIVYLKITTMGLELVRATLKIERLPNEFEVYEAIGYHSSGLNLAQDLAIKKVYKLAKVK